MFRRAFIAVAASIGAVRLSELTRLAGRRTRPEPDPATQFIPDPVFEPETWGLHRGDDGGLQIVGVDIADLVAEHGSPLHIVDARALDRNAEAALAPHRAGAGTDVYSSYKTNPIPGVLTRLHRAGVGAEAISAYEFWLAVRLGVPADRIVYNGPAKSPESLEEAARRGLHLVNANSRTDLGLMAAAAQRAGRPLRSGLRVSLPHMWGGQFGVRGSSDHVAASVADGVASPDLDFIGLHFHAGFPLATESELAGHLEAVLAMCDSITAETGWHPSILDLGGSLVCPTVKQAAGIAEPLTIGQASAAAWSIVAEHMSAAGRSMPELFVEPGRSLTGDTQFLVTTVLAVRDADSDRPTVVLDVGAELAEPMRGEPHQIFPLAGPGGDVRRVRLCGPRGDAADVLVDEIAIPMVQPGDRLAVMDTGAYFVPFSTASSFSKPAILLADETGVRSTRRRETSGELWRHDQL